MKTIVGALLLGLTLVQFESVLLPAGDSRVAWTGRGEFRLNVKIEPVHIGQRDFDQLPAEVVIDFKNDIASRLGVIGKLDVASIQVIRYDPKTGKPMAFGKYAYGTTAWDCPFRWYDAAIPYKFPDYHRSVASTEGRIKDWNYVERWGHLFGTLGEWDRGHLAWVHTQEGNKPSYYAIYFDVLPAGRQPATIPPQGFIGDGMERREPVGDSTTGMMHSRVAIDDWNEDRLFDLVVGSARGVIVYYPNRGTRKEPKFPYAKLVFTTDGKPLDVGISSVPLVVDWDGDGVKDLLVGANGNRVLFFKNVDTNNERRFENRGLLKVGEEPLAIPHAPVPGSRGVFNDDYHPVPEVVDWDGDGDQDLLLGGYVTGMIFYYENTGRRVVDGTPELKFRGPLEADGTVLDVEWCAAPTVADFDGDGDLDLITGTLRWTKEEVDPAENELFLRYFENIGSRTNPKLVRRPFPKRRTFPGGALVTPRAVDFNDDGLIDLVVSALDRIYLYPNRGSKQAPEFEAHGDFLPSQWGNAFIGNIGSQLVDWDGDGLFDIVTRFHVRRNEGKGWPNVFGKTEEILPAAKTIEHPAPMGDNYGFTRVADLDGDGKLDILFGDHAGHIYWHRNLTTGKVNDFDDEGVKLLLENGEALKVGPGAGAAMNFQVLQGARTTFDLADFNQDGKLDLVVGDTYGKVRYYQNRTTGKGMAFSAPELIGDMGNRMAPSAADWDGDGYPDVIGVASSGSMQLYLNRGSQGEGLRFRPGTKFNVPSVPYWPAVNVVDWNGDGDDDVMVATNYLYFIWMERSFIENGYAKGQVFGSMERTK